MKRTFILCSTMCIVWNTVVLSQDMTVHVNVADGQRLSRFEPLRFRLSRLPDPASERLAVFIGDADVTTLLTLSGEGFDYKPDVFPLPTGEVVLLVFLVRGDSLWSEIGRFTLHVLHGGGFDRATFDPSVTLANKGQIAEDHSAGSSAPPRKTFQEITGQFQFKSELQRNDLLLSTNVTVTGVSFKQDALRFGEKHEDAPKYDLSGYLAEVQLGRSKVSIGQVQHGRERHLLSGFSSRGLALSTGVGSYLDLSAAVMNGTNIVGWDNVVGLKDPRHRIYSGALGIEFLPDHPGAVRLEASAVDGSILPLNSFASAGIVDAEKSRGFGFRVLLSDPDRRVQVDGGLAQSRFTNPQDPLLAQSLPIVPVEATTRWAYYADVSVDVLRGVTLGNNLPVSLVAAFRHEQVDPLYRSVGAFVQSDRLQNSVDAHGGVGPVQVNFTYGQTEDNLANIPSVLKTKTRRVDAGVSTGYLRSLAPGSGYLPTISYGYSRTHQFGLGVPTNSNFDISRVPDQIATSHAITSEWQMGTTRITYRFSFALQDNQQVGHETSDLANRTNTISLFVAPFSVLTASIDAGVEAAENKEVGHVQSTQRLGTLLGLHPFGSVSLTISGSLTHSEDQPRTNSQRNSSLSLEGSYTFDFSPDLVIHWNGQVFLRYGLNEFRFENSSFNIASTSRSWSLNSGVNFNIF